MRINRVKLIAELARRDIKSKDFADIAGVSRATISSIRGGKTCREDVGGKIAAALGMSVEDLTEQEARG